MAKLLEYTTRFMAMLFLALFTFVSMPAELWHDHAPVKNDHHHRGDSGSGIIADADCPICDFQLLPYHFCVGEVVFQFQGEVCTALFVFYEGHYPSPFQEMATRGPPTVSLA